MFVICRISRSRTVTRVLNCITMFLLLAFVQVFLMLLMTDSSFDVCSYFTCVQFLEEEISFTLPCTLSYLLLSWVTSLLISSSTCHLLVYSCQCSLFRLHMANTQYCLHVGTVLRGNGSMIVLHSNFVQCIFFCKHAPCY